MVECGSSWGTIWKEKTFIYLWNSAKEDGTGWKRKQKITIGSMRNWEDIKIVMDELVAKL